MFVFWTGAEGKGLFRFQNCPYDHGNVAMTYMNGAKESQDSAAALVFFFEKLPFLALFIGVAFANMGVAFKAQRSL